MKLDELKKALRPTKAVVVTKQGYRHIVTKEQEVWITDEALDEFIAKIKALVVESIGKHMSTKITKPTIEYTHTRIKKSSLAKAKKIVKRKSKFASVAHMLEVLIDEEAKKL